MVNRRGQSCIFPNVTQVGVEKGERVGRCLGVSALRDGHMLTPFPGCLHFLSGVARDLVGGRQKGR